MSEQTTGDGAFWTWVVPLLAALAGAAATAAVFFLFVMDDDSGGSVTSAPAASPTPQPTPEDADELVISVPASCVEAAEAVRTVTSTLDTVAAAVQALDAAQLQETLDLVQDVRPEVERASEECLQIAADTRVVTPSPSASASTPAPAPTPTSTPTS